MRAVEGLDDLERLARFLARHEWRAVTADRRDHAGEHLGVALGLAPPAAGAVARLALGHAVGPAAEVAAQRPERVDPAGGPGDLRGQAPERGLRSIAPGAA